MDDIPLDDMFLQFCDETFVSNLPHITFGFQSKLYRTLFRQVHLGTLQPPPDTFYPGNAFLVESFGLGIRRSVRKMNVRNDLQRLMEVVKDDNS